ncbi:MAG: class I SAM-dependent methyltransferase [Acidimicrobiia bacterium]
MAGDVPAGPGDCRPSGQQWPALADWWVAEVSSDPAYREEVVPLVVDLLDPRPGAWYLDLGCGEGQVMAAVAERGGRVVGCDLSAALLGRARQYGSVVLGRLPELGWARAGAFDGACLSLVLEHLVDPAALFVEAARVVREGGALVAVVNHPYFTAPGASPVVDPTDGELFWRWGAYLEPGHTDEPTGPGVVRFHHRPLGELLTSAAGVGWSLEVMIERGAGPQQADRDPLLKAQVGIPRLLGARWLRAPEVVPRPSR